MADRIGRLAFGGEVFLRNTFTVPQESESYFSFGSGMIRYGFFDCYKCNKGERQRTALALEAHPEVEHYCAKCGNPLALVVWLS